MRGTQAQCPAGEDSTALLLQLENPRAGMEDPTEHNATTKTQSGPRKGTKDGC